MAIESFKCARHSLVCMSTIRPTIVWPGKIFKMEVLGRLENTIVRFVLQIPYILRELFY